MGRAPVPIGFDAFVAVVSIYEQQVYRLGSEPSYCPGILATIVTNPSRSSILLYGDGAFDIDLDVVILGRLC